MKWTLVRAFTIACLALLTLSLSAQALPLVLDYTGFSWGPPSLRGLPTNFYGVGVIDGFSSPVNDPNEVYTYYLNGLTLSSVTTYSATRHTYHYTAGSLSLYQSTGPSNRGFAYGTNPFNPTVPSTFTDGLLWLSGSLSAFNVFYDDNLRLGNVSAEGLFTSGSFAGNLQGDNFFSFAGLTARPGNGIPTGYGYRLDGQVNSELRPPVPEPASVALLSMGLLAVGFVAWRRRTA
jgi:hypothetical protein